MLKLGLNVGIEAFLDLVSCYCKFSGREIEPILIVLSRKSNKSLDMLLPTYFFFFLQKSRFG